VCLSRQVPKYYLNHPVHYFFLSCFKFIVCNHSVICFFITYVADKDLLNEPRREQNLQDMCMEQLDFKA
jgi:hypothetical protein